MSEFGARPIVAIPRPPRKRVPRSFRFKDDTDRLLRELCLILGKQPRLVIEEGLAGLKNQLRANKTSKRFPMRGGVCVITGWVQNRKIQLTVEGEGTSFRLDDVLSALERALLRRRKSK